MMSQLSRYAEKLLKALSIIVAAALTVNMVAAVISRYFFGTPITWADELSLFLFCWVTFLGAGLAVKRSEMAAVTIVYDRLPPRLKPVAAVLIQLFILLFAGITLYYAYFWITSPSVLTRQSVNLPVYLSVLYMIVPISLICMVIFSIEHIVHALKQGVTNNNEVNDS